MKKILVIAAAIMFLGAGCVGGGSNEPMTTSTNTTTSDTSTTPTTTTTPTTPTTTIPEPTPVVPTSTPTTTAAEPSSGGVGSVKIFMIALNDNGQGGKLVGCGDSVIPVGVQIPKTMAPLSAAIKALLAVHDQYYGQSGLYNALYQSQLQFANATITNGVATINLTGTTQLGGECDTPRFEEQLIETAKQFSTVQSAQIFINGKKMEDLLSAKG